MWKTSACGGHRSPRSSPSSRRSGNSILPWRHTRWEGRAQTSGFAPPS
ncbi:hypothetical protein EJO70_29805 [Variovorax sp. 553]|nr:hypothetical protein EJO70_29805 [Variovorax sp. 553]RSZ33144.1 hypothetical protein EJO71_29280 [Variovorax sp. 679]